MKNKKERIKLIKVKVGKIPEDQLLIGCRFLFFPNLLQPER